jgi:hypothetical protein
MEGTFQWDVKLIAKIVLTSLVQARARQILSLSFWPGPVSAIENVLGNKRKLLTLPTSKWDVVKSLDPESNMCSRLAPKYLYENTNVLTTHLR